MSTEPGLAPQGQKLPLILAAVAVVAVVIPAGLLGGVFAAPATGLPDAGTLVRWGLPIVRAIHDLAMASTVGLLLVAGTIIPEARTTSRRTTATRYACASGVVWVLPGLVGAAVARRRSSMVALAALGVLAILPLSLAGHASGAAIHDQAVNSLALHLVSAVVWVGGLLALAMLRPLLGKALGVSVQ